MKSAADHIASVTLELGGKSPLVVLNDADLDAAVEGALKAIYTNAGQVCAAGSRLVVEEGIAEAMLARLRQAVTGIKHGQGLDDAPDGTGGIRGTAFTYIKHGGKALASAASKCSSAATRSSPVASKAAGIMHRQF